MPPERNAEIQLKTFPTSPLIVLDREIVEALLTTITDLRKRVIVAEGIVTELLCAESVPQTAVQSLKEYLAQFGG